MKIVDLRDCPQQLDTLAAWHQREWAALNPGENLAMRVERMREYLEPNWLPSTFVALEQGEPLGSAAVVDNDMDSHPELAPWLASVFVAPACRRAGIGTALVVHVMQQARAAGVQSLFLFTPDQAAFYARLGWTLRGREHYRGHAVSVMEWPTAAPIRSV